MAYSELLERIKEALGYEFKLIYDMKSYIEFEAEVQDTMVTFTLEEMQFLISMGLIVTVSSVGDWGQTISLQYQKK